MSFKGDLSTIGLAEVFQMISMSQKEGSLVVQDSDSKKAIYFGATGVKLISTGKRKGMRLGDMLLRAGRISEASLSEALENSKIQKKMLGEVLVEAGYVSETDIQEIVREQIEEEIYDLFLWKKANFEFIEGAATDSLKDGDTPVTKLSFDVNGLLLEAVRRADEWSIINQKLPSIDSIFVFVSEEIRQEEDAQSPDSAKRVYRFVDGQTTVAEIVENTGVSRFEVCKVLVDLLDRGRLRLLAVPEMVEVAARKLSDGARDKGIKLYHAAAQSTQDPKVLSGVARVLEGQGQTKDAAQLHVKAGRHFVEAGDIDRAQDHMKIAESLDPDDPEIKMGMFEVHAAAGNLEEGKKLARTLVTQAMSVSDFSRARMLCDRILRADAADMDFRVFRARVLHKTNQKRDLENELSFIRKNMPVDPRQAEKIQRDLKDLLAKSPTVHPGPSSGIRPPPPKKMKKSKVSLGVGVLLLLGLGLGGKFELDAKRSLDRVIEDANQLMLKQSFVEARRLVDDYEAGKYRFSLTQRSRATGFVATLEDRTRRWEAEKKEREETARAAALEKMKALEASIEEDRYRNPASALDRARELREIAESAKDAVYLKRAEELASTLEKYLSDALGLKVKADELEKAGKFRESALLIDKLLADFPNTDAARDARYPLEITTRPLGVRVTSVRSGLVLGESSGAPLTHRLKSGEPVRLLFEKQGYLPVERDIKDKTVGKLHVDLTEKTLLWKMPLGITVTGEPALLEDTLFVVGQNRVYALKVSARRLHWLESLDGTIEGSPCVAGGLVCVGTASKWVYALDPRLADKRVIWRYALSDKMTGSPGASADGGILYVGTADRKLYALRSKTGELLWKRDLPAEIRVAPVPASGYLIVACDDGTLMALRGESPEEAWKISAGSGFGPLGVSEGQIFVSGVDQSIMAFDATSGKKLWGHPLGAGVIGRPVRQGGLVFASARDGKVYFLNASSGAVQGTIDIQAPGLSGPVGNASLVLVGSDGQGFFAFDSARVEPLWRLRGAGRVREPCVVSGNTVYFIGEENQFANLNAVELN